MNFFSRSQTYVALVCLMIPGAFGACVKPPQKRAPVQGAPISPDTSKPAPDTGTKGNEDGSGTTGGGGTTTPPVTTTTGTATPPVTTTGGTTSPGTTGGTTTGGTTPSGTTGGTMSGGGGAATFRVDVRAFWKSDAWNKTRALVSIDGVTETQIAGTNKQQRPASTCAKSVGTSESLFISGFKAGKNKVTVGMQTSSPNGGPDGKTGCLVGEFSYPKAQPDINASTADAATANRFKCVKGKLAGGGTRYQVCYEDASVSTLPWTFDKQFLVFDAQGAEVEFVGLACPDSSSIGAGSAGPNPCL